MQKQLLNTSHHFSSIEAAESMPWICLSSFFFVDAIEQHSAHVCIQITNYLLVDAWKDNLVFIFQQMLNDKCVNSKRNGIECCFFKTESDCYEYKIVFHMNWFQCNHIGQWPKMPTVRNWSKSPKPPQGYGHTTLKVL